MSARAMLILLVDDDADLLQAAAHTLQQAGFATVTASSGAAALASMHTRRPDLVLLDWDMPEMDGLEVCRRIKAMPALADILVVIFSGVLTAPTWQVMALESGADGHITRPIRNHELIQRVRSFERIWRLNQKLRDQAAELQAIHDATLDGIVVLIDRRFVWVNHAMTEISGYSADELLNQETALLYASSDDYHRVGQEAYARISSGGTYEAEVLIRRKDQETRWLRIKGRAIDADDLSKGSIWINSDISERRRMEETLRDNSSQLQSLSRRVQEAQETERRRLAIELHDELGQTLIALKINLLTQAQTNPACAQCHAVSIPIIDQVLQEVRSLALALRPSLLDDLGLVAALLWGAEQAEQRGDLVVRFDSLLPELRLTPEIEIACFRIVQEALTNIQRHAGAQQVMIELCAEDATLVLSVADDGCGFDPVAMFARATAGNSLGLLGMRERATLIGGTLEIASAAGQGCCVRLRCPLRLCAPA